MSQISPVVSNQYGPKEWLDLCQSDSARGIKKATLDAFAKANGLATPELVMSLIKRNELDPYLAANRMREMLLKERSRMTANLYRSQLLTFYRYAEVQFKPELFKLRVPTVKARHTTETPDIKNDELKAILLTAPEIHPMLQPFLEFLISTGWRVEEPFQVRVKDLDLEATPGRVILRALNEEGETTNKTGELRKSFLSSEAVTILKEYTKRTRLEPDDFLFPVEVKDKGDWAYKRIMRLLKRLGLTKREGYLDKWNLHPHSFRNINKMLCTRGHYNRDYMEALQGHATGVQGVYNMIEEMAREWVEQVEPQMRFLK